MTFATCVEIHDGGKLHPPVEPSDQARVHSAVRFPRSVDFGTADPDSHRVTPHPTVPQSAHCAPTRLLCLQRLPQAAFSPLVNCASSVEPVNAVVEDWPCWMAWVT